MKKIVALVLSLVMVLGLATTAFGATAAATKDVGVAAGVTTTTAQIQALAPQVDAAKSFATYGLLITDVTTKNVTSYGPFVKVPSATNADYIYVDGTEVIYLSSAYAAVKWNDTAEAVLVLPNADPACGQYYVTEANADKAGTYYLYDEKVYVEAAPGTATITFNVDGVLVAAKEDTTVVQYKGHPYKYDSVKTNDALGFAITKVYCTDCDKEFAFLHGTEAQAIAKFGAGNYDKAINSVGVFPVFVGDAAVVVPSTPAGDKVESAETFDAGIAMYVGMSVMAAAGSAVVLKKKD